MLAEVCGPNISAEITAIHFRYFALAADDAAFQFLRHRLAELVQQNKSALVGDTQIARECQRGLALDLVAEDRNGGEIAAKRQLVAGKQRSRCNGEILFARSAAEMTCSPTCPRS